VKVNHLRHQLTKKQPPIDPMPCAITNRGVYLIVRSQNEEIRPEFVIIWTVIKFIKRVMAAMRFWEVMWSNRERWLDVRPNRIVLISIKTRMRVFRSFDQTFGQMVGQTDFSQSNRRILRPPGARLSKRVWPIVLSKRFGQSYCGNCGGPLPLHVHVCALHM